MFEQLTTTFIVIIFDVESISLVNFAVKYLYQLISRQQTFSHLSMFQLLFSQADIYNIYNYILSKDNYFDSIVVHIFHVLFLTCQFPKKH